MPDRSTHAPPTIGARRFDDDEVEELRLAVVMSGGVSMCVWMGGVTTELDRLSRGLGAYGDLLGALGRQPVIDVVTGTSAGGINGALLAAAQVHRAELAPLRDLWVDKADFEKLLRTPTAEDPRSLLQGDEYLRPELEQVLAGMDAPPRQLDRHTPGVRLLVTTTLLDGTNRQVLDARGRVVNERTHLGLFRFDECRRRAGDGGGGAAGRGGDFAAAGWAARLALASRCSSAHPGGFEAAFVPIGDPPPELPDMAPVATWPNSQWALDGGLLANRPIGPAIEAIVDQPAGRQVRRLLLLVTPQENPAGDPMADHDDPPSLLGTLGHSLNIPREESIVGALDALARHNGDVDRVEDVRRRVAGLVGGSAATAADRADVLAAAEVLAPPWADRQQHALAGEALLLRDEQHRVSTDAPPVAELAGWATIDRSIRAWRPTDGWGYGPDVLLGSLRYLVALVRRALRITPVPHEPDDRATATRARLVAARQQVQATMDRVEQARAVLLPGLAAIGAGEPLDPAALAALGDARARLGLLAGRTAQVADVVADALGRLQPTVEGGVPAADPDQVQSERLELDSHRAFLQPTTTPHVAPEDETWVARFDALRAWAAGGPDPLAASVAEGERRGLVPHVARREAEGAWSPADVADDLFVAGGPTLPARQVREVMRSLLALQVLESAEGGTKRGQHIDFLQVTAEAPNAFGARCRADQKLTGLQLAHFGAFYKRSWRQNDWMWGRIDAAHHLVQALLDPRRLVQLGLSPAAAADVVETAALGPDDDSDADLRTWLGQDRDRWRHDVEAELAFLGPGGGPPPDRLERSTAWVARRIQMEVIRRELPDLAHAMLDDEANGAIVDPAADTFIRQAAIALGWPTTRSEARLVTDRYRQAYDAYQRAIERPAGTTGDTAAATIPPPPVNRLSPARAVELFGCNQVPAETLADDLGSDLSTRVVSRAALVAASVGGGGRSGLGPLRPVLAGLRSSLKVVHHLAVGTLRRTRATTAVVAVLLTLSSAAIALATVEAADTRTLAPLGGLAPALALYLAAVVIACWKLRNGWLAAALSLALLALWLAGVLVVFQRDTSLLGKLGLVLALTLTVAVVVTILDGWWSSRRSRRLARVLGLAVGGVIVLLGLGIALGLSSTVTTTDTTCAGWFEYLRTGDPAPAAVCDELRATSLRTAGGIAIVVIGGLVAVVSWRQREAGTPEVARGRR